MTAAYAVVGRHRDDQQAHQATEFQATEFQATEVLARQILEALPQVAAMLPPREVRAVLEREERLV